MKTNRAWILWAVVIGSLALPVLAQQMPQDNWYVERSWGGAGTNAGQLNTPSGIAIHTNGLVYVADYFNSRIQVFQPDGTFVRKWGSYGSGNGQFSFCSIGGGPSVASDASGLVYVTDAHNNRIQVFQPDGAFVRKWGSSGSGPGQFSHFGALAVDPYGLVYVVDYNNTRIQVFQSNGVFVRTWGNAGSAPGQFNSPCGIAIDTSNLVYVADSGRIQVFQSDGTFVRKWSAPGVQYLAIGTDRLVYTDVGVYEKDGTLVRGALPNTAGWFAFAPNGMIYATDSANDKVWVLKRGYRNPSALPENGIPSSEVLSVEQRGGTPYLDIDYRVTDSDDSTVNVAALAFLNGSNTLSHVLKLNTLIEGTATNIGPAVPANQVNRLTWNAAADWSTNFGQVKIEILAKDNRDLLDFHFLRIPSNGPDPELVIDRSPLVQNDFLSCWYWLIATNDPAITLTTGTVFGVGVPYAGKVLARGTNTTVDGRSFLFERLGVRAATSAEVVRARTAYTPGVTNQWTPRLAGDRRKAVNELGFDTYNYGTNAWFVVKP